MYMYMYWFTCHAADLHRELSELRLSQAETSAELEKTRQLLTAQRTINQDYTKEVLIILHMAIVILVSCKNADMSFCVVNFLPPSLHLCYPAGECSERPDVSAPLTALCRDVGAEKTPERERWSRQRTAKADQRYDLWQYPWPGIHVRTCNIVHAHMMHLEIVMTLYILLVC